MMSWSFSERQCAAGWARRLFAARWNSSGREWTSLPGRQQTGVEHHGSYSELHLLPLPGAGQLVLDNTGILLQ